MQEEDEANFPTRLRTTPSWLMSITAAQAQRLVWEGMASLDARRYHYALLAALEEFGPDSQASLGRRCGIDRSDVVAAINELSERNLVERTVDLTDRRRNTITITPDGQQFLYQLDDLLARVQNAILEPLSPDERAELVRLLTLIFSHHGGGW